jgi:uncharacterized protein
LIALPDVNLLLSLAWANHPHHHAAHSWFAANAQAGWATCLLTQIGLLRLSLNPRIVGVTLDCQAALALLTGLMAHPNHQFIDLAPTVTATPFDELVPRVIGHQQLTDATLLHVARFHGMKLATLDQATAALCPWSGNVEVIVP